MFFQLRQRERVDLIERKGTFERELVGRRAAQRGKMAAAAEFFPEIVRERTHVGALRAAHAEINFGQRDWR